MADTIENRFQGLPHILYGTAFKFENSATLVEKALIAGFRAIDTAGGKPQYEEKLVGEGIAAVLKTGNCKREDLYIQTKFSPFKANKNPSNYPYDTTKPISEQVAESVASSLSNLGTTYLDCLVLHSHYPDINDTLTAWRAMEALVPAILSSLGCSNTDLATLRTIYEAATIKPVTVQNRFTSDTADKPNPVFPKDLPYPIVTWDRDVRAFCLENGMAYAPWGVLWAALEEGQFDGNEKVVERAAKELGISKEIACYALMGGLGGCRVNLLCGTSNAGRMGETLEGLSWVERFAGESEGNREIWEGFVKGFRAIVDGSDAQIVE